MTHARTLRTGQAGFTLIELMVALVMALMLITVLVLMQSKIGQQVARSKDVSSRDDQTRVAIDRITTDLSSAGFLFGGTQTYCNALFTYNGAAGTMSMHHEVDAAAAVSGSTPALVPSLTLAYPPAGVTSDILVVTSSVDASRFSDATAPLINAAPNAAATPMATGTLPLVSTSALTVGDAAILQVPDSGKRACLRVPVTSINAGVSITSSSSSGTMPASFYTGFAASLTSAGFTGPLSNAEIFQGRLIDIGSTVSSNQAVTAYYIDQPAGGYPTLMRATYSLVDDSPIGTPQAIAAGVIALQVRFGVDPGNTGAVTEYDTAATVTANKTWDAVRSVRVLLVGRPLIDDPDPNYTWPASPAIGLASPYTDFNLPTTMTHRRYSIQQTEIAARNLLWK